MEDSKLKILSLSDQVVEYLYGPHLGELFPDIDLIVSCGDLPYYYLEFILDQLNVPLYFVHGNHDPEEEIAPHGTRSYPWGGIDLHQKMIVHQGLILFGLEGSIRYSKSKYQYTQSQMWGMVIRAIPGLLLNRIRYGRFLDVFITHSPAWQITDAQDPAHLGFQAFRWLLKAFKPRYHIHGHVHVYDRHDSKPVQFMETTVINTCSYKKMEIDLDMLRNKK